MSWFKVDDRFHSHPKVVPLPLEVVGLWTRCGSYCANHPKLEGVISLDIAALFAGSKSRAKSLAAKLVAVGMWSEVEGGWRFHDWLDFNPSADEVEDRRSKRSEAGRVGGQRSAEQKASKRQASCLSDAEANAKQVLKTRSKQNSTPSRPVPSRPDPEEKKSPQPPLADSNSEWGLEPERASSVQAVANEHADAPPAAGVTPRQLEYQRAYESGIAAGKGAPYAMPEPQRCELHRAIAHFAKTREGKEYRGDTLIRWITHSAKEFAQQVRGKEATFYSSFGPRGFVKWLNEAEFEDGEEARHG